MKAKNIEKVSLLEQEKKKTNILDDGLFDDIFLLIRTTTFCNYIDGNTTHSSDKNTNIVINRQILEF